MFVQRTFIVFASILTMAGLIASPAPAMATTPSYILPPGVRLTVGHCIYSTSHYGTAKLCMEYYGNAVMYYKGVYVDEFGANSRFNSVPSGYLVTTKDGYIRIYQYSGGPLIWQYANFNRLHLTNLELEIGATVFNAACLAVTNASGDYWLPWKGTCPGFDPRRVIPHHRR